MFKYLFPYEKIEKGSRVILYGAGDVGRDYYNQCQKTRYCDVILWVDRRWKEIDSKSDGIKISDIVEIEKYSALCDFVIVAINDRNIKEQIVKYLLNYVEPSKIIWRKPDFVEEIPWENARRLEGQLCNIIPNLEQKKKFLAAESGHREMKRPSNAPVKVRFIVNTFYWWQVIESVAKEYLQDEHYDVLLIRDGQKKGMRKYMEEKGFKFEEGIDYDVQEDCPDIVFMVEAVSNKLALIRKYARLVICIHGSIVKWEGTYDINTYVKEVCDHVMSINPDYYIFDKLIYQEMQNAGLVSSKTVLLGNPKFDHIYRCMQEPAVYPYGWEKLKEKKVVLWTTDHCCFGRNVSFDLFAKSIFEFFESNPGLALIFRPHPLYIVEMLKHGIWTQDDVDLLRTYINQSPNMVWDDRNSYDCAYRICDAVMADADCGIICSSLPLEVPIAALIRPEKIKVTQPELVEHLYQIRNVEQLKEFFEVVESGIDRKREERIQAFHDNILSYDGKIGQRVKEFVSKIYAEQMQEETI